MKYTVGQLAKVYNISPQTIHSYVEMGILECERDANSYRIFDSYGFQKLGTIIKLRNAGFPLKDCDFVYQQHRTDELVKQLEEVNKKNYEAVLEAQMRYEKLAQNIQEINAYLAGETHFRIIESEGYYRINAIDDFTNEAKDSSIKLQDHISKWYSHLFHTNSSLELVIEHNEIKQVHIGVIATSKVYHRLIQDDSKNVNRINKGYFALKYMSYLNRVNTRLLQEEIHDFFKQYPQYKLRASPMTRLILSSRTDEDVKLNIFELIIPIE